MGAGEILFSAHIEVVVRFAIEHEVKGLLSCCANRTGGESCITIGVIWGVCFQMRSPDPSDGEIP